MTSVTESLKVSAEQFQWGIEKLREFVSIPCVSNTSSPDHSRAALQQAAAFAGNALQELDFDIRYISIDGAQPYVLAKRVHDASLPTIVVYAHYDKQPVDRSEWKTNPFELVEKDGRLYGRGASDDGGGLAVILTALKVRKDAQAKLPVNLIVLLEGEEEVASPHMAAFLQQEHAALATANTMVIMDGMNRDVHTGTLNSSTRGIGSIEVKVTALQKPIHSGIGVLCPDPNMVLSKLIASLEDPRQIPGYMDSCTSLNPDEIVMLEKSTISAKEYARQNGVVEGALLRGDTKTSVFQRIVTEPSISIVNQNGGTYGGGNSIPASATATINMRFTPGQDPVAATQAVINHLRSQTGLENYNLPVEIKSEFPYGAWGADLSGAFLQCYYEGLKEGFGVAALVPCGGTIPLFPLFEEAFPDMELFLVGVEDPDTAAHSHNESQDIGVLEKSINSFNAFLDRAGQIVIKA